MTARARKNATRPPAVPSIFRTPRTTGAAAAMIWMMCRAEADANGPRPAALFLSGHPAPQGRPSTQDPHRRSHPGGRHGSPDGPGPIEIIKVLLTSTSWRPSTSAGHRHIIRRSRRNSAMKWKRWASPKNNIWPITAPKIRPEQLKRRPPVVTIMGHVDHGGPRCSTPSADQRDPAAKRAASRRHIGAYHVKTKRGEIVFLDTPGHRSVHRHACPRRW